MIVVDVVIDIVIKVVVGVIIQHLAAPHQAAACRPQACHCQKLVIVNKFKELIKQQTVVRSSSSSLSSSSILIF